METEPIITKETLKKKPSVRYAQNFEAIKHNFEHRTEIENKVGISFALEQTEAKLTMHNELAARFQDSSLETLSQGGGKSGIAEAPPSLGFSDSKAMLGVDFGDVGMKKISSSPELNSPEEAIEESEGRSSSLYIQRTSSTSSLTKVKRAASLRDGDSSASGADFKESLNRKLNQGGAEGLSNRRSCKPQWKAALQG